MATEIVTIQDLQHFKVQLLDEIKTLLQSSTSKPAKEWLKNAEVRKLLNISSNTIQRLRISGKLRSSKVGGIHFYRYDDIAKLLSNHSD